MIQRRTLLAGFLAGTALAAVGCSSGIPVIGSTDPDAEVKAGTAASEAGLIAIYDSVIEAFPALGKDLTPFRDQHSQHLSAIVGDGGAPASANVTIDVASQLDAARLLRRAERQAAKLRVEGCVAARDASLSELLSVIGSCEAAHATFLAGVR
ncbi:MAG: hypothetical protein U0904_00275 [Candidatus Nanopelagicales bacterium]|nr:hypothetical protein [Candidatus Nanopelagicales bacterium]